MKKERSERSKIMDFSKYFESTGFELIEKPILPFDSMYEFVSIFSEEKKKQIVLMPFVRPEARSKRSIEKSLGNYPQIHILYQIHKKFTEKAAIVEETMKIMDKWQLYFIVVIPVKKGLETQPVFWIGKYSDIPKEYWKCSESQMLIVEGFKELQFVDINSLKEKLDKIFAK